MVSTRQMATSNSSGNVTSSADESARLSVVTRVISCPAVSPAPLSLQRSLSHTAPTTSQLNLLDMPTEILSKILSYLGYKKVGQLRVVSTSLNDVCMHILNSTFSKLIKKTFTHFQAIKANMPRRESARRSHPLACECDIIETCYMRLSLLQMTFGKHIERGHCCFFPGAILDEVYTILNYIKNTPRLERPYRVTDELFDLSTMAMEYFRDNIEPTLPDIAYFNKDFFKLPTTTKRPSLVVSSDLSDNSSNLPSPPQSNMVLRKGIRKIKQGMKIYNNQLSVLRNELRTCKRKSSEQGKQIAEQQKLLAEQQKQTLEYANRLDENDKKNEEISRKFSTLLQELNKCRTELQYWRSKSPAISSCTSCGHKVGPILPPEDYQALINQGVKPEDILNMNEETDAESDTSMSENNIIVGREFVFPDQATTAKLLAVNTAAKNLKRHHTIMSSTNSSSSGSNTVISGNISCDKTLMVFDKTTEMISCLNSGCTSTEKNLSMEFIGVAGDTTEVALDDVSVKEVNVSHNGYSTKLFYGANVHKGVIVSPSMLTRTEAPVSSYNMIVAADNLSDAEANSDVYSLQTVTSHETKKARRVQKATRCVNGSGKRSK